MSKSLACLARTLLGSFSKRPLPLAAPGVSRPRTLSLLTGGAHVFSPRSLWAASPLLQGTRVIQALLPLYACLDRLLSGRTAAEPRGSAWSPRAAAGSAVRREDAGRTVIAFVPVVTVKGGGG